MAAMPTTRTSSNSPVDTGLGYTVARRPRLEFARACTSLHHSTLADQSSSESSPQSGPSTALSAGGTSANSGSNNNGSLAGSRRGIFDLTPGSFGPFTPGVGTQSTAASVDGSVIDDYDSSTDDDADCDFELTNSTAQTPTSSNNMFRQPPPLDSPTLASSHQAMQAAVLMRNPKTRMCLQPSRGSSSSASSMSLTSPSPTTTSNTISDFSMEAGSRRNSLSRAIQDSFTLNGFHDNNSNNNNDEGQKKDPVKRVVTRRGNLLPKTKNFQRIKAALMEEECSPADIETKREAEIIHQLREEDDAHTIKNRHSHYAMLTGKYEPDESTENAIAEDDMQTSGSEFGFGARNNSTGGSSNVTMADDVSLGFSRQAQRFGGIFNFDSNESVSGSPPRYPSVPAGRINSDGDIVMASDSGSAVGSPAPAMELRKMKRRRTQEERFEAPDNFKRRAVSPGLCGSPILGASPGNPQTPSGKRLDFGRGINDTHDGLMKMTLQ